MECRAKLEGFIFGKSYPCMQTEKHVVHFFEDETCRALWVFEPGGTTFVKEFYTKDKRGN